MGGSERDTEVDRDAGVDTAVDSGSASAPDAVERAPDTQPDAGTTRRSTEGSDAQASSRGSRGQDRGDRATRDTGRGPRGLSLHLGVNYVGEGYTPPPPELYGCVNDANDMADIASDEDFDVTVLVDEQATSDAFRTWLEDAADTLDEGDMVVVSVSSHGGQLRPFSTDRQERDRRDETVCLFDREVLDDEVHDLLCDFSPGVEIFTCFDLCHAGGTTRSRLKSAYYDTLGQTTFRSLRGDSTADPDESLDDLLVPDPSSGLLPDSTDEEGALELLVSRLLESFGIAADLLVAGAVAGGSDEYDDAVRETLERLRPGPRARQRALPEETEEQTQQANYDLYRALQERYARRRSMAASLIYFGACAENQLAQDGDDNGLFTGRLVQAWRRGRFRGGHRSFHDAIVAGMPPTQSPVYLVDGQPDRDFELRRPFTLRRRVPRGSITADSDRSAAAARRGETVSR